MQHTQINLESHTCSHTLLSPVNMNCTSTSTTVEHGHISKVVFLFCYIILIAQKIRITYLLTVTCFMVIFLSVNVGESELFCLNLSRSECYHKLLTIGNFYSQIYHRGVYILQEILLGWLGGYKSCIMKIQENKLVLLRTFRKFQ